MEYDICIPDESTIPLTCEVAQEIDTENIQKNDGLTGKKERENIKKRMTVWKEQKKRKIKEKTEHSKIPLTVKWISKIKTSFME